MRYSAVLRCGWEGMLAGRGLKPNKPKPQLPSRGSERHRALAACRQCMPYATPTPSCLLAPSHLQAAWRRRCRDPGSRALCAGRAGAQPRRTLPSGRTQRNPRHQRRRAAAVSHCCASPLRFCRAMPLLASCSHACARFTWQLPTHIEASYQRALLTSSRMPRRSSCTTPAAIRILLPLQGHHCHGARHRACGASAGGLISLCWNVRLQPAVTAAAACWPGSVAAGAATCMAWCFQLLLVHTTQHLQFPHEQTAYAWIPTTPFLRRTSPPAVWTASPPST